jgi:hypothetical protein
VGGDGGIDTSPVVHNGYTSASAAARAASRAIWGAESERNSNRIARGSAGDCWILCGAVAENLLLDHGGVPNIDVDAYRAQLDHALAYHKRGAA